MVLLVNEVGSYGLVGAGDAGGGREEVRCLEENQECGRTEFVIERKT